MQNDPHPKNPLWSPAPDRSTASVGPSVRYSVCKTFGERACVPLGPYSLARGRYSRAYRTIYVFRSDALRVQAAGGKTFALALPHDLRAQVLAGRRA